MHIPATFPTAFGPRTLPPPPMVRVSVTPHELFILIRALERESAEAERDGHDAAADLLFRRALAPREALR